MKYRAKTHNKSVCNNFNDLGPREAVIKRAELLLKLFPRKQPEVWIPLPVNSSYEISSWGRVRHLKSYGGKPRILLCTIRYNKYPLFTITNQGKRIGISLRKFLCNNKYFRLTNGKSKI